MESLQRARTQLPARASHLNLEHYLDVLEKKPGAMKSSAPLQQWQAAGQPAWIQCGGNWKAVTAESKARAR